MKNFVLFLLGAVVGAGIVYYFCCKKGLEDGVVVPNGVITAKEAQELDRAYNSRHQLISDSIVKRPDNRSSWYSLEDMRNYLTYAESEVKALGYNMTGVRIYVGAYPSTANEAGYTTLFMVPTGNQSLAKSSMLPFNLQQGPTKPDVPGGPGLNEGPPGNPPSANYPQ